MNAYSYALNRPTIYVDPTGRNAFNGDLTLGAISSPPAGVDKITVRPSAPAPGLQFVVVGAPVAGFLIPAIPHIVQFARAALFASTIPIGHVVVEQMEQLEEEGEESGEEGDGENADEPASEQEARDMGRRIGREIDRQAQHDFHNKKRPGEPDRSREQLRQDAEDIFRERGLPVPDWVRGG